MSSGEPSAIRQLDGLPHIDPSWRWASTRSPIDRQRCRSDAYHQARENRSGRSALIFMLGEPSRTHSAISFPVTGPNVSPIIA